MACDLPKVQLYLYLDGELDPQEASAVEQHLHTCDTCQGEAAAHRRLQHLLCSSLPSEDTPVELWAAIKQKLPGGHGQVVSFWRGLKHHKAAIAGLASVVLMGVVIGGRIWFVPPAASVVREIVDSQIRARLMDAPYKNISSEAGAVRRWFQDKVAFSVVVPEMPVGGYIFQGVRLNYFLDRRVAEIAYVSQSHTLSFLMFSNRGISLQSVRTVPYGQRRFFVQNYKGYNAVLWKDGAYFCSLVSDLHMPALLDIARTAAGNGSLS